MSRVTAIAIVLALAVAACGNDADRSSGNAELIAGLTDQIADAQASDRFGLSANDTICFADGLIDRLGADRMADSVQLDFEDFMAAAGAGERRIVVDVMFDCVDFGGVMARELASDLSDESAKCLSNAFVASDGFRDALADSFTTREAAFDDPALVAEMLPSMLKCLTPDELIDLGES